MIPPPHSLSLRSLTDLRAIPLHPAPTNLSFPPGHLRGLIHMDVSMEIRFVLMVCTVSGT